MVFNIHLETEQINENTILVLIVFDDILEFKIGEIIVNEKDSTYLSSWV